jgi:hypothetical protein
LREAKAYLPREHWRPWLKANVPFCERIVHSYMRMVREWPTLEQQR